MKTIRVLLCSTLAALVLAGARQAEAQSVTKARYMLLEGSTITDDCLICGRPTIQMPLRGTFELELVNENPLFARYRLSNIAWSAGNGSPPSYAVTGQGEYRFGGEVALVQEMTLDVQVNGQKRNFTNDIPTTTRLFPLIDVSLTETQHTLFQFFTLRLVAAPVREIWFSTEIGFTSAFKDVRGGPGDLLSASGRIVKSYSSLVGALGIPIDDTDSGIDAVEIGPGGEVFFSFDQRQVSPVLGPIQHGDLVSNRGRIVKHYYELVGGLGIMPVVPDVGLDAVHFKDDGEVLFSISTNIFSERLGQLQRGDLLSSRGTIVARNAQLLARFHPITSKDFGLDALYVWPNGEVWFSTEEGFQDNEYGQIGDGDLLSNQGLIVFRNLELMSAFAPLEDVASFGLDALYIVTDITPPAPPPRITSVSRGPRSTVFLRWEGEGKVFQLLKSTQVNGPYVPLSVLMPEQGFLYLDGAAGGAGFYRVRQW